MKNILFIVTALITQIACAGTITLADGSKITSPKIADGQTEFSLAIGDETYQFSGKHSQKSLVAKPFHYFQANPLAKELSYKEVIKKNGSAVVTVLAGRGLGSGFIIHPDGYIITNQHVVSGSYKSKIKIKFHTKQNGILKHEQFSQVRVLAVSHRYDLALLKIEGFEKRQFPYVTIASAHNIEKGDEIVAIGAPRGLDRTATKGFVGLSHRVYDQMFRKSNLFQLVYIQHTAEINPGNSGGPLFNMKGQVVGVNSLGSPGSDGLGFAISADFLRYFLANQELYKLSAKNMTSKFNYLSPPGLKEKSEDKE